MWYQIRYDHLSIASVLIGGEFSNNKALGAFNTCLDLLTNVAPNPSIRFEKPNELSLPQKLSEYLEGVSPVDPANVQTSASEIDYVLNRFLSLVKIKFNHEKSLRNY